MEIKQSSRSNKVRPSELSLIVGNNKTKPSKNSHPQEKLLEKMKIAIKSIVIKMVAKTFSVRTKFNTKIMKPTKIKRIELLSKFLFRRIRVFFSRIDCFMRFN